MLGVSRCGATGLSDVHILLVTACCILQDMYDFTFSYVLHNLKWSNKAFIFLYTGTV